MPASDDDATFEQIVHQLQAGAPDKHGKTADAQQSDIPLGWKPTLKNPVPVIRCTRIKPDGNRCNKYSLRGTTVCIKHGAQMDNVREKAAAVVEAARMHLLDSADDAIDTLQFLMQPGTSEGVRLKAASEVLDRVGIRGGFDVDVTVEQKEDPAEALDRRLAQISARLEESRVQRDEIVGEIVEDVEDEDDPNQDTLF